MKKKENWKNVKWKKRNQIEQKGKMKKKKSSWKTKIKLKKRKNNTERNQN